MQEWGVLTDWQKTITGPMNYRSSPRSGRRVRATTLRDIANVADSFYDGLCKGADPKPEMMALAKPAPEAPTKEAPAKETKTADS